ncbi:hypothetical protein EDB81DRAFT_783733 [Dactylonectria macrodidyma]|uniref:Uncharacterized protein n=1 Tax=Dactylonectria macrodidyma TaxID=307937 RepID=A0A9P9JJB9_9HYPO|nr:hypothetical protein EDB81DRAFT_783733 [Dactylonectria macrodidyma]
MNMDDYAFKDAIAHSITISEEMTYLQMFSYTDPSLNLIDQRSLIPDEFDNFLHRRGIFAPTILPDDVSLVAGVRLIVQENANHKDTFAPGFISMKPDQYSAMVEALHLPQMAIEMSSVVGPLFWSTVDHDDNGNAYLQMIFRKSDVRKKGKTRGWEIILSHEFSTGITTGFCKGTPSSNISPSIKQLKACMSEIGHAILLPVIVFSYDSSSASDVKQRNARDWLRRIENVISMRNEISEVEGYFYDHYGSVDLDALNRDLVECQAQVLWKRPEAYISIIDSIQEAAGLFMQALPASKKSPAIEKFERRMTSRLEFYRKRWAGIDTYANTTMQRLEIQRSALYNFIAQKESRLNLQIASDQQRLAHTSKRESEAMKGISLLGTIFLPGAFTASIFSTTFFDFKDASNMASVVSPRFWLFWVVTIPFTLAIVGLFLLWEKRRMRLYQREDENLERALERMERDIMAAMRKRTMSKVSTWVSRNNRKAELAADEENDYGAFREPTVAVSSNALTVPPRSG